MKTKVAIDVSGLAWKYKTGVQNLYWDYVNAWVGSVAFKNNFDFVFYDRSGLYNRKLGELLSSEYYQSVVPIWWPDRARRLLQAFIKAGIWREPKISGAINHVWNWGIYDTGEGSCSITIPDILPLEYPDWFSDKFIRLTKKSLNFAKNRAQYVFAISEYVRQQIIEVIGVNEDRVWVVYPGIDPLYLDKPNDYIVEMVLSRYGLKQGRFVISSGFLDPRKNLVRQIQAFSLATRHENSDVKYVLTGVRNVLSQELLDLIKSPEISSKVVFIGYVSRSDLSILMGKSAALMYCSIAEGFGLPIIEAMAAGAPVITSATTSMLELAHGRAITVDPFSVEEIANAVTNVLGASRSECIALVPDNRRYAAGFTCCNWLQGHLRAYSDGA